MTDQENKRPFLLLGLLFLLLLCFCETAHAAEVEVRVLGPEDIETRPGRVLALSFSVTNRSNQAAEFIESAEIPEGWNSLLPLRNFRLGPGENMTRIVPVQVPPSARAGNYEIIYSVKSREDPGLRDTEAIGIKVLQVEGLRLFMVEGPREVFPGESYIMVIQAVNGGNTPQDFTLESEEETASFLSLPKEVLPIAPGETQTFEIPFVIPKNISEETIRIRLAAVGKGDKRTLTTIFIRLEVLLDNLGRFDPYNVIPTSLELTYTGDGDRAFQATWSGVGFLDEEGDRRLAFSFRGPDATGAGLLGQEDQYWIDYDDRDYALQLGDQNYSLSRLTSRYTYGRGIGAEFHPEEEDYRVGFHYLEGRSNILDEKESAFFISKNLSSDSMVQLNYIEREDRENTPGHYFKDRVFGLQSEAALGENWQVEAEYGWSDTDQNIQDPADNAYYFLLRGEPFESVSLSLRRIYAEPHFFGEYTDYDSLSGTLGFPISPAVRAFIDYSRYRDNLMPERFPSLEEAREETLLRAYFDWALGEGWYVVFGYDDYEEKDLLLPRDFYFTEQSLWLRLGRSLERFSWEVEARHGNQTDKLEGESRSVMNYRFYLSWLFSPELSLRLYGNLGDDEALEESYLLRDYGEWGGSLSWQATRRLLLQFWYTNSGFDTDERPVSEQYSLLARHEFPNQHVLQLELRKDSYENSEDETSYGLTYIIPVKLKLNKKKNIGALEGYVLDATTPEKGPVSGVILSLAGKKVATDEKGYFLFPDLPFGAYFLQIQPDSLGQDRTTVRPFPLRIDIGQLEPTPVEIEVVQAGTVTGRVTVSESSPNEETLRKTVSESSFRDGQGLGSVLIELKSDTRTLRRLTESDGNFAFPGIPAGSWQLKVYENNIPPALKLDNSRFSLDLSSGQEIFLEIRARKQERKIKMLEFEQKTLTVRGS